MRLLSRCVVTLALPVLAHAQSPYSGPVTIGKRDSIWSKTIKEARAYMVYTPPSYSDTVFSPRRYPVIYLLDGGAHFHSVSALVQILGTGINGTFVLPEMIVVAIGNTDRFRDMTTPHVGPANPPTAMPLGPPSRGGMPNFLQFIKSELIPHIDSTYRTAPYRVFIGHSLGGITAINALYTMPETFNAYVAIDPSLWYDDRVLLKKARDYFSKPGLAGRVLYVGQANTINPADTTTNTHFNSIVQFNAVLQSFNASGLRYAYRYYENDDHGSVPLIAEYDALHFIFDGYKPDINKALERPAYVTEHFTAVSQKLGYQVRPPENIVDMLSQFAASRDTTKALELLQLNTELYPDSPRAFVALGDLRRAKGDSAGAKQAYERALAINPRNQRAKESLAKLNVGR